MPASTTVTSEEESLGSSRQDALTTKVNEDGTMVRVNGGVAVALGVGLRVEAAFGILRGDTPPGTGTVDVARGVPVLGICARLASTETVAVTPASKPRPSTSAAKMPTPAGTAPGTGPPCG